MRRALAPLARLAQTGLLTLITASACERPSAPAPAPQPDSTPTRASEPQPANRHEGPDQPEAGAPIAAGVHYIELVTGGAATEDRLPMILAIHGLGDTPAHFAGVLRGFDRPARVILPRGLDAYGQGWSWFEYRAADNDPERLAAGIRAAADRLAPAIEQLARERPTVGAPIVTGFSQGGMLSFALAVEHGELIAAALPIGGALPEPMQPEPIADETGAPPTVAPIHAFHGEADTRVPLAPTAAAVEQLRAAGFEASLRSYPGVGHTISPQLHDDWLAALRERLP